MDGQRLSLHDDFIKHFDGQDAWPPVRELRDYMKDTLGYRWSNDTGIALKRGAYVKRLYIDGLIGLLLADRTRAAGGEPRYKALAQFLTCRGCPPKAMLDRDTIVRYVTESPDPFVGESKDWLSAGLWAFHHILPIATMARRYYCGVYRRTEIGASAEWLFVGCGRQLTKTSQTPTGEAIQLTERTVSMSLENYERQAVAWQAAHPWTVVNSRSGKHRTGVSVVLPVSEDFYNSVLAGEAATFDCPASQIMQHSRFLIIDGVVERPLDLGGTKRAPTHSLFGVLLAQIGILSRCHLLDEDHPLHILSYAVNDVGEKRLSSVGFTRLKHKDNGKDLTMCRNGLPLMQRILRKWNDGDKVGSAASGLFSMLSVEIQAPPAGLDVKEGQ